MAAAGNGQPSPGKVFIYIRHFAVLTYFSLYFCRAVLFLAIDAADQPAA